MGARVGRNYLSALRMASISKCSAPRTVMVAVREGGLGVKNCKWAEAKNQDRVKGWWLILAREMSRL